MVTTKLSANVCDFTNFAYVSLIFLGSFNTWMNSIYLKFDMLRNSSTILSHWKYKINICGENVKWVSKVADSFLF